MARLCERPGCSAPAACVYAIDAKRLRVRLDALSSTEPDGVGLGHRAGVLCRRHADSMVVPLGWTLDDRRPADRRTAAPVAMQPPPAAPRRPQKRRERSDPGDSGVEQLALLSLPVDPPDMRPALSPVDGRATPPPHVDGDAAEQNLAPVDEPAAPESNATDPPAEPGTDIARSPTESGTEPVIGTPAEPVAAAAETDGVDAREAGEPAVEVCASGETPADPWRPVFDQTDDLGGLLTARSPLLARAFGRRDRRAAGPDATE